MKIPTNIEEFEYMEYNYDQIILITKFENLNMYFKSRIVMVYDIDTHQLNLEKIRNLKLLDEIPLKKYVSLHLKK